LSHPTDSAVKRFDELKIQEVIDENGQIVTLTEEDESQIMERDSGVLHGCSGESIFKT
jgi:hypothetical protein